MPSCGSKGGRGSGLSNPREHFIGMHTVATREVACRYISIAPSRTGINREEKGALHCCWIALTGHIHRHRDPALTLPLLFCFVFVLFFVCLLQIDECVLTSGSSFQKNTLQPASQSPKVVRELENRTGKRERRERGTEPNKYF